jgi:transposase
MNEGSSSLIWKTAWVGSEELAWFTRRAAMRLLATDRQQSRLDALFADDLHVEVEATWSVYQNMITAYREPDRGAGRQLMQKLVDAVSRDVPAALIEVVTLGRTLKQ